MHAHKYVLASMLTHTYLSPVGFQCSASITRSSVASGRRIRIRRPLSIVVSEVEFADQNRLRSANSNSPTTNRRSSILSYGKVGLIPAPATIDFFMILGRTDLRMGASKAKFDSGNDFEVRSAVDLRKRHEKMIYRSEKCFRKFSFQKFLSNFSVRLGIVRNAFWQSFAS